LAHVHDDKRLQLNVYTDIHKSKNIHIVKNSLILSYFVLCLSTFFWLQLSTYLNLLLAQLKENLKT